MKEERLLYGLIGVGSRLTGPAQTMGCLPECNRVACALRRLGRIRSQEMRGTIMCWLSAAERRRRCCAKWEGTYMSLCDPTSACA